MSIEGFALWLGVISAVIGIVAAIHQFKLEKVLKTTALLCLAALCCVLIWRLMKDRDPQREESNLPISTAGESGTGLSPVGSTPRASESKLKALLADVRFYKEEKQPGFSYYDKKPPYEFRIPARFLDGGQLEKIRKDAEEEINRPKYRSYKITTVSSLQFGLSEDGARFYDVLVLCNGTRPRPAGDGEEPLIDPAGGKWAAVTLTFDPDLWTPAYSDQFALQLLRKLHAELGAPDRGETRKRNIKLVEE